MSISNLFVPNAYQLYCDTIQAANDTDGIVTLSGLEVYSGATLIHSPITLIYQVSNGLMTLFFSQNIVPVTLAAPYTFISFGTIGQTISIPYLISSSNANVNKSIVVVDTVSNLDTQACFQANSFNGTQGEWSFTLRLSTIDGATQPQFTGEFGCEPFSVGPFPVTPV